MCHRQKGIGADGVIILNSSEDTEINFLMSYYNSDGNEVEMCGNGARCASHYYVHHYSNEKLQVNFKILSQIYSAKVSEDQVSLKMHLPQSIFNKEKLIKIDDLFESKTNLYIEVGVPHCVFEVDSIDKINIEKDAMKAFLSERFENGVNVNFYERAKDVLKIRSYERGVNGETLSCGTGIVATAISFVQNYEEQKEIIFESRGGELKVQFIDNEIFLVGAATKVFEGTF